MNFALPHLPDALLRLFAAWQFAWSLVAFVGLWRDKQLAREGRTRLPERQLHRYEAWGGWAGSFIGQQVLRHKNRKASYQRVFLRLTLSWLLGWAVLLALKFLTA